MNPFGFIIPTISHNEPTEAGPGHTNNGSAIHACPLVFHLNKLPQQFNIWAQAKGAFVIEVVYQ